MYSDGLNPVIRNNLLWVVAEWDVESISAMIAGMETVMANPEAQSEMSKWMEKLATLIDYAEAENWLVR